MATAKGHPPSELQENVVAWLKENGVVSKLDEAVNALCSQYPDVSDPFGFLVQELASSAKTSKISAIKAREVLDAKCQFAAELEVSASVRGEEKLIGKMPALGLPSDRAEIQALIRTVNEQLAKAVSDIDPANQHAIDAALTAKGLPAQFLAPASCLCAQAGAALTSKPSFQQIAEQYENVSRFTLPRPGTASSGNHVARPVSGSLSSTAELSSPAPVKRHTLFSSPQSPLTASAPQTPQTMGSIANVYPSSNGPSFLKLYRPPVGAPLSAASFALPRLVFPLISGGKSSQGPGGLSVSELVLITSPATPVADVVAQVATVHAKLGSLLAERKGAAARLVKSNGCYAPEQLVDPEEALNIVEDAVEAAGLVVGDDVCFGFVCSANNYYNEADKKYTVIRESLGTKEAKAAAPQTMSLDEMIEWWVDLKRDHPALIYLENPLADKEGEAAYAALRQAFAEEASVVAKHIERGGSPDPEVPVPAAAGSRSKTASAANTPAVSPPLSGANTARSGVAVVAGRIILVADGGDFTADGLVIGPTRAGTLSDWLSAIAVTNIDKGNVIISTSGIDTDSTFTVDLAIGVAAPLLHVGAFGRPDTALRLNRFQQLHDHLLAAGQLQVISKPAMDAAEQELISSARMRCKTGKKPGKGAKKEVKKGASARAGAVPSSATSGSRKP